MPRAREVKITKDGQEATVLKESVPVWERNGWTVTDDGSSEQDASTAPASAQTTTHEEG